MDDRAHRLIVLWKNARDKYRSFFSVLNEVRREIGDDALSVYCREQLRISLSIILETSKLLSKTDAEIVKEELAAATRVEKAKRAIEREAQESARHKREKDNEDRKRSRELEKIEHERKLAEKHAKHNKIKDREKTRQKRQESKTQRGPYNAAAQKTYRHYQKGGKSNAELAKTGYDRCEAGDHEWVEGSIMMANALADERQRHTNDASFGGWYKETGLPFNHQDRAALIQLGRLETKEQHRILDPANRSSNSYQLIMGDYSKSRLRAVD
jgi:flagellar biosynthesis GTPase FlhF